MMIVYLIILMSTLHILLNVFKIHVYKSSKISYIIYITIYIYSYNYDLINYKRFLKLFWVNLIDTNYI